MIALGRLDLHLAPGTAPEQQAALRRQATSALGYAALAPRGLPPHAVLIVRRLADPLPGDLLAGSPWQAGDRWGDAARSELARMWRSAVRPAHAPVPPDVEAVWFADLAEWLACLTLDLYQGVAHLRWWWRTRLTAQGLNFSASQLSALWQAEARSLPAALAYLHEHSQVRVAAILDKLPPPEMQVVLRAVLRAHALPPALLGQPFPRVAWEGWVPKSEAVSSRSPQVESGAALLLAVWYAPAALRRLAWEGPAPAPGDAAPPAHPRPGELSGAEPVPFAAAAPGDHAPAAGIGHPPEPGATSAGSASLPPTAKPTAIRKGPPADSTAAAQVSRSGGNPERVGPQAIQTDAPLSEGASAPAPAAAGGEEGQVHSLLTGLGGVWLLVNLLIAHNQLKGEFSPWLKLEVLARCLLAGPKDDDSVWDALAELQGRERTPQALEQAWSWLAGEWAQIEAWLLERLESIEELALDRRATCYITQTHIDVVFAMDEISVPLRLIGLDRDPGWVPELARVIQFHYE